jgi:Na+/melibiose symporter-like transporter
MTPGDYDFGRCTTGKDDRLSLREKIGYGLGDAGGTVITCLIMNFLTFSIPMSLA